MMPRDLAAAAEVGRDMVGKRAASGVRQVVGTNDGSNRGAVGGDSRDAVLGGAQATLPNTRGPRAVDVSIFLINYINDCEPISLRTAVKHPRADHLLLLLLLLGSGSKRRRPLHLPRTSHRGHRLLRDDGRGARQARGVPQRDRRRRPLLLPMRDVLRKGRPLLHVGRRRPCGRSRPLDTASSRARIKRCSRAAHEERHRHLRCRRRPHTLLERARPPRGARPRPCRHLRARLAQDVPKHIVRHRDGQMPVRAIEVLLLRDKHLI